MKYNLELLRADIEDELRKIARLEQAFAQAQPKLDLPPEQVGRNAARASKGVSRALGGDRRGLTARLQPWRR